MTLALFVKKHRLILLSLFVLILITYGNSFNNVFLSDDLAEIVNNPNVGNLSYAVTSHPTGFVRLIVYWLAFHIVYLNMGSKDKAKEIFTAILAVDPNNQLAQQALLETNK